MDKKILPFSALFPLGGNEAERTKKLTKIIVINDDPTGSQTLHSCLLLTRWDANTLLEALFDASPLFFVLSNTRDRDAECVTQVTAEIHANLREALAQAARQGINIEPLIVSRSDSRLLTELAGLPPQPVAPEDMSRFVRNGRPGVILMGSHGDNSTRQLDYLREFTDVMPVHLDLYRLEEDEEGLFADLQTTLRGACARQRSVVLYSRGERGFPSKEKRLAFGERIAAFLVRIVQHLPQDIGFLISKGGLTSNDTLSKGLALRSTRVLGQIHPGCSVVRCPDDHPRFPDLPVVLVPGNEGGDMALGEVYRMLSRTSDCEIPNPLWYREFTTGGSRFF